MLTYTFSTREKILLAVLAFVAIGIAWYQLVFLNIQGQVATIDSEIATLEDQVTVNQTKGAALARMRGVVESYQQQGVTAVLLPSYDNTQNLMAYLNGVLGATQDYTISFDTPVLGEEDNTVHRSGIITFNTGSYAEARSIIEAIVRGPYPSEVNAFGITDTSAQGKNTKEGEGPVTTSVDVTFFEKPTGAMKNSSEEKNAVEGQDLSKLKDWNNQ